MNINNIEKKDRLVKGLLAGGSANMVAISGRALVEAAREAHGLSRVCTAALGRTLLAAAMMSVSLKGEAESLTCVIKGGGPAGNIVCTGYALGRVKGYLEHPNIELPPTPDGKLDVAMAVGWFGELMVIKDLSMKEPYTGRCNLVSGEIAEDFAQYFTVSEQQPSLVYLGVRVDASSGAVLGAGGLLIQPLPQCPDAALDAIQKKTEAIGRLTERLSRGEALEKIFEDIFSDTGIAFTQEMEPLFHCDCSLDRIERALMLLGKDELTDMIRKDHGAKLTCRFCGKEYVFDEADLTRISGSCERAEETHV